MKNRLNIKEHKRLGMLLKEIHLTLVLQIGESAKTENKTDTYYKTLRKAQRYTSKLRDSMDDLHSHDKDFSPTTYYGVNEDKMKNNKTIEELYNRQNVLKKYDKHERAYEIFWFRSILYHIKQLVIEGSDKPKSKKHIELIELLHEILSAYPHKLYVPENMDTQNPIIHAFDHIRNMKIEELDKYARKKPYTYKTKEEEQELVKKLGKKIKELKRNE